MENSNTLLDLHGLTAEINRLFGLKNFDGAIVVFAANGAVKLSPNLLVAKSMAIQLAADPLTYSLDDARHCLVTAIELDPKYADAWIDLGYFYFAIDDDANKAIECFKSATQLSQEMYQSSIMGFAKALAEAGDISGASVVMEMPNMITRSLAFEDLRIELLENKLDNC